MDSLPIHVSVNRFTTGNLRGMNVTLYCFDIQTNGTTTKMTTGNIKDNTPTYSEQITE